MTLIAERLQEQPKFVGDPTEFRRITIGVAEATITDLSLQKIRADGGTQSRAQPSPAKVEEYEQIIKDAEGWPFPPLVVYYDGTEYWLADGFHRRAAAARNFLHHVPCEIRQGTRRDAVLFACGANATHGLPRNDADKRRAVETLLRDEEWSKWSDREIARRCAVSATFVGKIRAEVSTVHVDSRIYTRSGQVQAMNTAEIGKTPPPQTAVSGLDRESKIFYAVLNVVNTHHPMDSDARLRAWIDLRDNKQKSPLWQEIEIPEGVSDDEIIRIIVSNANESEQDRRAAHWLPEFSASNDDLPASVWLLQSTMATWFIPDWSPQDRLNFVNTALRGPGPARDDLKSRIKHLNCREEDVTTALENLAEIYQGQIAARVRNANQTEQNRQIAADAIAKRGKHAEWLDEQLEAIDDEVEEMLGEEVETAESTTVYYVSGNVLHAIADSYSASRIAFGRPVKPPADFDGKQWLCVSFSMHANGEITECAAYQVVSAASSETYPYIPGDAYHTLTVICDGEQLMLLGPRVEFRQSAESTTPATKQRPLPPPGYLPYENRSCPSGCEKNLTWQPAQYQVGDESWSRYQTGICNVCGCQLWSDYVWPYAFYYNPQTTKSPKTLMEILAEVDETDDDENIPFCPECGTYLAGTECANCKGKKQPPTPTAAFLPKHLGELHNQVMRWYIEQRLNNIPGQLELMRSIQQQKSNHELWPEFIAAMPPAFNEADLYQVIDHLTEYLQVRSDETRRPDPRLAELWQVIETVTLLLTSADVNKEKDFIFALNMAKLKLHDAIKLINRSAA